MKFETALKQHESLKTDLKTTFTEFLKTNPNMGKVVISAAIESMCETVRDNAPCKHARCFANAMLEACEFLQKTSSIIALQMLLKEEKNG